MPAASMGPRPSDRGRPTGIHNCEGRAVASMGPRPSDRGRRIGLRAIKSWGSLLQWVHGLLTVGDLALPVISTSTMPALHWVPGLLTVGDEEHPRTSVHSMAGFNGSTAF